MIISCTSGYMNGIVSFVSCIANKRQKKWKICRIIELEETTKIPPMSLFMFFHFPLKPIGLVLYIKFWGGLFPTSLKLGNEYIKAVYCHLLI